MNTKYPLISLLILIILFSCEKNKNLFQPNASTPVVSLNKGNVFCYHFYNRSNCVLSDWFENDIVTGDTIINHINYSIIDNKRIERADNTSHYLYINGDETIKLKYDISEGDIIPFMDINVKVDSIKQENIFNKGHNVIYVSNKISNSDTLITGKYTMIFGVLSYSESYNNFTDGYSLSGALIDGIEYGQSY
ncbi:MAG: hypothetical protein P8078_05635 [bacterium]